MVGTHPIPLSLGNTVSTYIRGRQKKACSAEAHEAKIERRHGTWRRKNSPCRLLSIQLQWQLKPMVPCRLRMIIMT